MTEKRRAKDTPKSKGVPRSNFYMQATGTRFGGSLLFFGVDSIKEYFDTSVLISIKRESIKVEGEHLKIAIFEEKTLEISGKIEKILISSEHKKEKK